MKQAKCRYCGTLTNIIAGYPPLCDSQECNEEDRQAEIERNEMAQEAAREDGYSLYGGSGE
jgi:hypothetical protein